MVSAMSPVDPSHALAHWSLTLTHARSPRAMAQIFDVAQADGTPAILKLYRNSDLGYELHAPHFYRRLDGNGAVRLLGAHGNALLLERQDGPDLTMLSENQALDVLIGLAAKTAAIPCSDPSIRDLRARYTRLTACAPASPALHEAQVILQMLLEDAETRPLVLLHADLHHQNVLDGARSWLMIDPIVVRGVPEAEFAQVFRNPRAGTPDLTNPDVALTRAHRIAGQTGFAPRRLLEWGVVKTAHSLVLAGEDPSANRREADVLGALLIARTQA